MLSVSYSHWNGDEKAVPQTALGVFKYKAASALQECLEVYTTEVQHISQ